MYNYSVQFFFSLSHWCRHFCDFCLILLHTRRALALHPSDATHRLHDRNEYWQFNKDCNIINGNFSTPRTLYETRHVEMSGCTKTEQLFWADASRKQVMSLENVTGDIKSLRFNAQHSSTLSSCENRSHFYVSHCTVSPSVFVYASHTAHGGTELAVLLLSESWPTVFTLKFSVAPFTTVFLHF